MTPDITDLLTFIALGTKTEMASPGYTVGDTSMTGVDLSAWASAGAETAIFFGVDRVQTVNGKLERVNNTYTEWKGILSGNTVGSLDLINGTDQDYPAGSGTRMYMNITAAWGNAVIRAMLVAHNKDGTTKGRSVPTGMYVPFAGGAIPDGWLLCYGQPVSRATYSALYGVIGTTYGVGDSSTTFNLPDYRGRTPVGRDDMGGTSANRVQVSTTVNTTNGSSSATVGSATGLVKGMYINSTNIPANTTISTISGTTIIMSANATVTASGTAARFSLFTDAQQLGSVGGSQSDVLDTDQIPSHTHSVPSGGLPKPQGTGGSNASSIDPTTSGATGGGQAHPNLQPSLISNWIIAT